MTGSKILLAGRNCARRASTYAGDPSSACRGDALLAHRGNVALGGESVSIGK